MKAGTRVTITAEVLGVNGESLKGYEVVFLHCRPNDAESPYRGKDTVILLVEGRQRVFCDHKLHELVRAARAPLPTGKRKLKVWN